MDAVPRYVRERLWLNPVAQVLVSALYKVYEIWCFENDEYQHKKREFYQRLETYMAKSGHRLIRGVRNSSGKDRIHKGVGLQREMPEAWRMHVESKPTGGGASVGN
ncbi:primase-like DNA-binding domain-containing protein [Paenibacillus caui]|uniref:primase-like DNA-binding domain-containing protein n=1 Tax=Paenibacillus caui TaxID=2873927 RepID=UPI003B588A9F